MRLSLLASQRIKPKKKPHDEFHALCKLPAMKSVLVIAYFFPPDGSAGSYRPLRFVRGLAKKGWRSSVITADPYYYERYDRDLLTQVPQETKVIRVRGHDAWQALQSWRRRRVQERLSTASLEVAGQIRAAELKPFRSTIRRTIQTIAECHYHPDFAKHWIRPAVKASVKLCGRMPANVIWASAGPVSAWVVAQRVSAKTGVPYVLDLRDPHGLIRHSEAEVRAPKWVDYRLKCAMYRLFKGAQAVVFLFDTVAESYCRAFPGALDPSKIHIIPNGYEGTTAEFVPPNGNKFTVLYTGTLVTYRYDTLLQALVTFKNTAPAKAQKLRFVFVGEGMEDLVKEAARLGLSHIVETMGATSNAGITRLQRESHAFLVLGRLSSIKGHELFAGAKVFGYLKASRPIFGILPQDETRKVLRTVGVSTIANVDSAPEIASILGQLWDAWSEGKLRSLLPDPSKCDLYSAEPQTAALVRALNGAIPLKPFVPGSAEVPPSLREDITKTIRASDFGWTVSS